MSTERTPGNSLKDLSDQSKDIFARTRIPFEKEREEVWEELAARIRMEPPGSRGMTVRLRPARHWIGMAASIALLVSVTAFMRFYRVTTQCPGGEQVSRELPDGSIAELNGPATLSLHPLWWPFSRKVIMEGEIFFHVREGGRFEVSATEGTTEVLGTTFNVYARDRRFEVTCHSGRVLVSAAGSEQSVILSQDQRAALNERGSFDISKVSVGRFAPLWKSDLMMFTSTPLRQVFDEIQRHYGIRVTTDGELNYIYSGRFTRGQPVENVLSLVCRPFDLVYERKSGSEFHVYPAVKDR